jgi:hypothetical protein
MEPYIYTSLLIITLIILLSAVFLRETPKVLDK